MAKVVREVEENEIHVLFRTDGPKRPKPKELDKGDEIWVWRPWLDVDLPKEVLLSAEKPVKGYVLFCSRFHVRTNSPEP